MPGIGYPELRVLPSVVEKQKQQSRCQVPMFWVWLAGFASAKSLCARGWRQDLQTSTDIQGMCVLCVLARMLPGCDNHLRIENISLWEVRVRLADDRLHGLETRTREVRKAKERGEMQSQVKTDFSGNEAQEETNENVCCGPTAPPTQDYLCSQSIKQNQLKLCKYCSLRMFLWFILRTMTGKVKHCWARPFKWREQQQLCVSLHSPYLSKTSFETHMQLNPWLLLRCFPEKAFYIRISQPWSSVLDFQLSLPLAEYLDQVGRNLSLLFRLLIQHTPLVALKDQRGLPSFTRRDIRRMWA